MAFPDGKLNESDEGSLAMHIAIEKNRVILDFGKDLSWLGLDKQSLRQFIDVLEKKYEQLI